MIILNAVIVDTDTKLGASMMSHKLLFQASYYLQQNKETNNALRIDVSNLATCINNRNKTRFLNWRSHSKESS